MDLNTGSAVVQTETLLRKKIALDFFLVPYESHMGL